jgi:hypothetical protein
MAVVDVREEVLLQLFSSYMPRYVLLFRKQRKNEFHYSCLSAVVQHTVKCLVGQKHARTDVADKNGEFRKSDQFHSRVMSTLTQWTQYGVTAGAL